MQDDTDTQVSSGVQRQINALKILAGEVNSKLSSPKQAKKLPLEIRKGLAEVGEKLDSLSHHFSQQEQRHTNLLALADIGKTVNSTLETGEVLRVVMDTIVRLTGAERGFLMLKDEAGKLAIRIARNWEQETLNPMEAAVSQTIVSRVAAEGQPVVTTNAQEDPAFKAAASVISYKLRSILCVPLKTKDKVTGVIYADNRVHTGLFSEADSDLLTAFADQAAIALENANLFEGLQRSNLELKMAYDTTLSGWARALELRDQETEGHCQRVTDLTAQLAERMGIKDEEELIHIRRGATMHDIGKMGIPDSILLKPGKLNKKELKTMRKHPVYAYEMLSPIEFLQPSLDIPYCHHEKMDGSGYPRGLKGDDIPLSARIFAVVDVWDALTSDRPYREAMTEDEALSIITEDTGTHFDPQVVKLFLELVGGVAKTKPSIK